MDEKNVINMVFKTDLGKFYTIRLTNADPSVSGAEVRDVMLAVIDSQVIAHANGEPVSAHAASLVKTESAPISVI